MIIQIEGFDGFEIEYHYGQMVVTYTNTLLLNKDFLGISDQLTANVRDYVNDNVFDHTDLLLEM